jgi:hypothetical protein
MSEIRLLPKLFLMSHTLSQEETLLPTVVTELKEWLEMKISERTPELELTTFTILNTTRNETSIRFSQKEFEMEFRRI